MLKLFVGHNKVYQFVLPSFRKTNHESKLLKVTMAQNIQKLETLSIDVATVDRNRSDEVQAMTIDRLVYCHSLYLIRLMV